MTMKKCPIPLCIIFGSVLISMPQLAVYGPLMIIINMNPLAFTFIKKIDSIKVLRNKYKTYGHPVKGADSRPLGKLKYSLQMLVV